MITHDQVMSEIEFLEEQMKAWYQVLDLCSVPSLYHNLSCMQIGYLEKRIETLKGWDAERWQLVATSQ